MFCCLNKNLQFLSKSRVFLIVCKAWHHHAVPRHPLSAWLCPPPPGEFSMGQLQLQQCFYTSAYPIFKKTHSVDTLCTYNMYNSLHWLNIFTCQDILIFHCICLSRQLQQWPCEADKWTPLGLKRPEVYGLTLVGCSRLFWLLPQNLIPVSIEWLSLWHGSLLGLLNWD